MDWHSLKVMSTYAVLVFIFLIIVGRFELAIFALIGYTLYGFFDSIKRYCKSKKLDNEFANIPNNIKEITICHITKRHPKLKRKSVKIIKEDIKSGNYKSEYFILTEKTGISPVESDAGYDYYLSFNNDKKYHVPSIVYDNASVGDVLWIVKTPTEEMKVIKSKKEWFNMFII